MGFKLVVPCAVFVDGVGVVGQEGIGISGWRSGRSVVFCG